jgi:hypothetical protein
VDRYRPRQPFQGDRTQWLGLGDVFDGAEHPLADENLTGFRFGTDPGCKVRNRADCGIVEATLEPDPAQRGVALAQDSRFVRTEGGTVRPS